MSVSRELESWLESVMLDESRLKKAVVSVESTFEGYNLSDEEKEFLRNPELMTSNESFRPMIIRNINSFNKENTTLIARLPEQSVALRGLIQSLLQSPESSIKERLHSAANSLIDTLHHEVKRTHNYRVPNVDKCDIRIVGMGMRSVDQITREALRAILGTKKLYLVDGSPGI